MGSTVALCIVFNHAYPSNVERLLRLYRGRFDEIVFLMPLVDMGRPDCFTVFRGSYNSHGYVADAREFLLKLNCDAYVFCGDDALLHPELTSRTAWTKLGLDSHDAFIPEFDFLAGEMDYEPRNRWPDPSPGSQWGWLPRVLSRIDSMSSMFGSGVEGYQRQLPTREHFMAKLGQYGRPSLHVQSEFASRPGEYLLRRTLRLRKAHELPFPMAVGISDLFAVRRNAIPEVCRLLGVFAAADIFVEVAIPTTLLVSANRVATCSSLQSSYYWTFAAPGTDFFRSAQSVEELAGQYPDDALFIHPVKLSRFT